MALEVEDLELVSTLKRNGSSSAYAQPGSQRDVSVASSAGAGDALLCGAVSLGGLLCSCL